MFFLLIDSAYTHIRLNCQLEVKEPVGVTLSWFRNEVALLASSNGTSISGELKTNSRVSFGTYSRVSIKCPVL